MLSNEVLRLSQLPNIVKLKRHTLNARIRNTISQEDITRTLGHQILLSPIQIKQILTGSILIPHGKIIYIGNLKGGVGKTTIAYLLSNTLRLLGVKVCVIDLDVQANLTNQFLKIGINQPVFCDIIDNVKSLKEVIIEITPTLHLIPSSLKNSLIPKVLTMQSPKHHLTWFNSLCLNYLRDHYDIILVDTPPSFSTLNSVFCLCLTKEDHILIPVCAEDFSIMGVEMFLNDILDIRKSYAIKEDTKISIIMNRFFQTQKNNLEMLLKMTELYKGLLSETVIKDCSKIREIVNNKIPFDSIKGGKEIYDILSLLLQEINVLKI